MLLRLQCLRLSGGDGIIEMFNHAYRVHTDDCILEAARAEQLHRLYCDMLGCLDATHLAK